MRTQMIEKRLERLTLRQKIGQMVCARAYRYVDKMESMLSAGHIGSIGIGYFGIRKLEEYVAAVNRFNERSQMPLTLLMDAEAGISDNFDFGTAFPTFMALGAAFSPELAYRVGHAVASEASAIGARLLGCPVLDLNTNPENPIIGTRAFSDRPELTIRLGIAYVKGMQEAGVVPLGKHFPGHGDTSEDSHMVLPRVDHNKAYLLEHELKPFIELIRHGMSGIMTAHIVYPALLAPGEEEAPATISRTVITGLLRQELNFNGIIVSDSLTMKAIKDHYGEKQSAILSVQAGHDIILQDYDGDPEYTVENIHAAVKSGLISERQIDDSVRRIWGVMERLNIPDKQILNLEDVRNALDSEQHRSIAREVADKSVTVLENRSLPFPANAASPMLVIATVSEEEGTFLKDLQTGIATKAPYFYSKIKQICSRAELLIIKEDPDPLQIAEVKRACSQYRHIIYANFVRIVSYKEGSGTIPPSQREVVNYLNEFGEEVAFMIFGNPYFLRKVEKLKNCLCMYGDCNYSIDSGVKVLFGALKARGRLPVAINEAYPYGYGLV